MSHKTQKLPEPTYLSFPFRVGDSTVVYSDRSAHVKELIEQVLFTNQKERIFRANFGAGIREQIFEPNSSELWKLMHQRLVTSLSDALLGEVEPKTIEVDIEGAGGAMIITVSYKLATIDRTDQHRIQIKGFVGG
jgi:uncharacterized protein